VSAEGASQTAKANGDHAPCGIDSPDRLASSVLRLADADRRSRKAKE